MSDVFRCGHPRTPENTRGQKEQRCKMCASQNQKASYAFNVAFARREREIVMGQEAACASSIETGSKRLLEALWREHPSIVAHLTRGRPETIERQRKAAARLEEARMRFALVEREAAQLGVANFQA